MKKILYFSIAFTFVASAAYFFKYHSSRSINNRLQERSMVLGTPNFTGVPESEFNLIKHVEKQWGLKDIEVLKAWAKPREVAISLWL